MDSQDFKKRCEYELLRENMAELFQKYETGALNSSAALWGVWKSAGI